jgi:hypothetical protein
MWKEKDGAWLGSESSQPSAADDWLFPRLCTLADAPSPSSFPLHLRTSLSESMSVDPPRSSSSPSPDSALLSLLREFVSVQNTRTAIAHEFDDATAAFYADPPTIAEAQLNEVIRITTLGLMECSDSAS